MHTKVRHQMNVGDLIFLRYVDRFATRYQFVGDKFAQNVLVHREGQIEIFHIAIVVLNVGKRFVQFGIQAG